MNWSSCQATLSEFTFTVQRSALLFGGGGGGGGDNSGYRSFVCGVAVVFENLFLFHNDGFADSVE